MGDIEHSDGGEGVIGEGICEKSGDPGGREIDKGALGERRELVEDACGGFFSGAGLADNQGGAEVRCDAPDLASELGDCRT